MFLFHPNDHGRIEADQGLAPEAVVGHGSRPQINSYSIHYYIVLDSVRTCHTASNDKFYWDRVVFIWYLADMQVWATLSDWLTLIDPVTSMVANKHFSARIHGASFDMECTPVLA